MTRRRLKIGRDPNSDIVLDDATASRRHAEARLSANGEIVITDCGSANGIRLLRDGKRSSVSECQLRAGDRFFFGEAMVKAEEITERLRPAPPKPGETEHEEPRPEPKRKVATPSAGSGRRRRDPMTNELI